jgi:transposase
MTKTLERDAAKVLLARGYSISKVARLVGVTWPTAAKATQPYSTPNLPRKPRSCSLAPFRADIERELAAKGTTCTELFGILSRSGFTGSLRTVQRYVRRTSHANPEGSQTGGTSWATWLSSTDHGWMLRLTQASFLGNALADDLGKSLEPHEAAYILKVMREGRLTARNRIVAIAAHLKGIETRYIAEFLGISSLSVNEYVRRFLAQRFEGLLPLPRKPITKAADTRYSDALFALLHAPPGSYGINRCTWTMLDLKRVLSRSGLHISLFNMRQIIWRAGYRFRKAKVVLTSHDPLYHEKLTNITSILRGLRTDEKFFSVDEFGPLSIKLRGGVSLLGPDETKVIPQYQKSKGQLIVTAALELSTNQICHFYSRSKNTAEMIKLLEELLRKYQAESRIYFSWDAASWHASKALRRFVDEVNSPDYRSAHKTPVVELAPLPASAQFLNVIESVFSGMARAIIHSSDYPSVDAAMAAIDRYFAERNQHFTVNPRRAGNKIWGQERTNSEFAVSNNCKDPAYR